MTGSKKNQKKRNLRGASGKAVQDELDRLGIDFEVIARKRHYRIQVLPPKGDAFTITVAQSPSDHRSRKNMIALIRRKLRDRGVKT